LCYYQKRQKKNRLFNKMYESEELSFEEIFEEKLKNGTDIVSIIPAWKQLTKAFRGVSPHSFYRELPYEVLEERKKGTLKSIASEMKKWTQNNRYEYV
jgi:hypothetical protein